MSAASDKDAAAAVKQMKKPSRAAWAINQVARKHPKDIQKLLAAGDKLRDAQEAALRGDASKLRPAGSDVADAVDLLAERVEPTSASVRAAVINTLRAAAVDAAARELVKAGTLTAELEPAGFGLEGVELPADFEVTGKREPKGPDPHLVAEAERAEARAARLQAAAAEAETRASEARLAAEQAVAEAERARAAADASIR